MNSIWQGTSRGAAFPDLAGELSVDVSIIGGGITGMTVAMLLARARKRVAVLEARQIGSGTTGHSTGNLYSLLSAHLYAVREKWDEETVKAIVESRTAAINLIEQTSRVAACGFRRRPWHLYSMVPKYDEQIIKEYDAAVAAWLDAQLVDSLPLPVKFSKALKVENQAQFHPLDYVRGMARAIASERCRIFENSPVIEIDHDNGEVRTERAKIKSQHIIHATHTPKGIHLVQTAMEVHREYGIAAKLVSGNVPRGIFWGLGEFSTSIRSLELAAERYLIVVGGMHKTGEDDDTDTYYEQLERFAHEHFDLEPTQYRWSAQQYRSADLLPYIGTIPGSSNTHIATGFFSDGLTYGTLAGMILSDCILGRANPWARLYSAKRFTPVKSVKGFAKKNVSVLTSLARDHLTRSSLKSLEDLEPGEGALIEVGSERLAVYRDENRSLRALSPVCPHMKCLVHWNAAEKTWDCPCHGSRFALDGSVIEGPSVAPLEPRTLAPTDESLSTEARS
jgi:glycine/D-amino acid oxidase-like deaminating enzyme/nitrite reductase/ring-hydroxylating ferredoxin subunit